MGDSTSDSARRTGRRLGFWGALVFLFVALVVATDESPWRILIAVVAIAVILKVGFVMIGGLARPVPAAPPPGELRKVKITYRCSICGTEVRMTMANDEMPDAPRHCQDEMDLVTPIED